MRLRDRFTMREAWRWRYRIGGTLFFALGLAAAIWLGFAAASKSPPDGAQSALLVLVSAVLQAAAAWSFGKHRPDMPDERFIRTAVRHTVEVRETVSELREVAEVAMDLNAPATNRAAIGRLSWQLSGLQQQVEQDLRDWLDGFPDVLAPHQPEVSE